MSFNNFDFGLDASDAVFPVSTRPIAMVGKDGATMPIHTHKAIIRANRDGSNPRPLGVVGIDYKQLPHGDLFGNMEDTLRESMEPSLMRDAKVDTEVSFDGAFVRREYVFPRFADELETSSGFKTRVGFRIIGWNSLDGSFAAGCASGLIDFFCTNGCVSGSDVSISKRRHTLNLRPDHFRNQIVAGLGRVQDEIALLRKLANTALDFEKAENIIKADFSETRAKKLMERVKVEAEVRGQNVFALHSALTYFSSHNSDEFKVRDTGNDNVAATLHNREAEIAKVMPKVYALAA